MSRKKIKFKHRIEYIVFIAFVMLIKILPLFAVRFNRRLLRLLLKKISKKKPGTVTKNLRLAFPDYREEEISRLADAVSDHFASILVEIITLFVKQQPGKILKEIEIIHLDFLERALEKKKGVILFSAHFGNWELIPFILSRKLDRKINSVARKMDNPLVEKRVKQFREYMGSEVIDKTNSIRTIINRLEKNDIIYMLIDQNTIEREAVFVEFFGKTAGTVPSVSKLHLRRNIPIIPVFLHYEPGKIVLELMEEIDAAGTGTGKRHDDLVRLTQRCTSIIEEKVRQYPEQWFWFHNRWKTAPSAEGCKG